MEFIIHFRILSVGLPEPLDMEYAELFLGCKCELAMMQDYRELYSIPVDDAYDVAVLGERLSGESLTDTARFIRNRWPDATIMIVSAEPFIDDPLYDRQVSPSLGRDKLITEVCRLYGS